MIRTLNYTKRLTLSSDCVQIKLERAGDNTLVSASQLQLPGGLPTDGKIFLEAYFQSLFQRFDLGTINVPRMPEGEMAVLREFYDGCDVQFRLKVVDASGKEGRIAAVCAKINYRSGEDGGRSPIIPVKTVGSLGQEIWRVVYENGFILELNQEITNIKEIITRDRSVRGVILPEVLRIVLTRILFENLDEESESGPVYEKASKWLELGKSFSGGIEPPPLGGRDHDLDIHNWVNDAVRGFCRRHSFRSEWEAEREKLRSSGADRGAA